MKNNKAFTLIEIIAVILILAIISVLAFPKILKQINSTKGELSDSMKDIIYSASNLYASDLNLDKVDGNTYCVTLQSLVNKEYLNDNLIDPVTKDTIELTKYVEIKVYNSNYEYQILDNCTEYIGPNKPEILDNMIPVKYDGTNWIYANINNKWYDYNNKEWANAVILNSGVTKNVGDTIQLSEIAQMYVWIPRYKYTIFNGNNEGVESQEINVTFESGVKTTGTVRCIDDIGTYNSETHPYSETCTDNVNNGIVNNISTYTHPAFTFGGKQLKGIWVGKFENSAANVTSNTVQSVIIKPNVTSWRSASVSTFYTSIENTATTYDLTGADSHMMKNMEWGSVAYLKQSKYGLGTTDIGINNNSSYTTGCGAVTDTSSASSCNAYSTSTGMLASTTGNIYGVYDMSGGAWEYVMGNMATSSNTPIVGYNTTYTSGFTGIYNNGTSASGTYNFPNIKYASLYSYDASSNATYSRGKLGDATKEVLTTLSSNTGGWYGDYMNFPYSGSPWFIRGGLCGNSTSAGVFYFNASSGSEDSSGASRSVITIE